MNFYFGKILIWDQKTKIFLKNDQKKILKKNHTIGLDFDKIELGIKLASVMYRQKIQPPHFNLHKIKLVSVMFFAYT